eukprot:446853_1
MATDLNFSAQLKAERTRRRDLTRKQHKNLSNYVVDSKYNQQDQTIANQKVLKHCDQLNDAIDHSLDASLAMTAQTASTAADTCNMLNEQRDQIKKMHKDVHQTNEILKDSERSIQTVQSWKKGIINWFRGKRQKNEYHGMDTDTNVTIKKRNTEKKQAEDVVVAKKWNKQATSDLKKMEQQQKLKQIDNYLDDLLDMADDMGNEINNQNDMIEELQFDMEDLEMKFNKKNRKLKRIARK